MTQRISAYQPDNFTMTTALDASTRKYGRSGGAKNDSGPYRKIEEAALQTEARPLFNLGTALERQVQTNSGDTYGRAPEDIIVILVARVPTHAILLIARANGR